MYATSRQSRQVRGAIRRSLCLVFLVGFLAGPARTAASADTPACRDGSSRLCLLGRFEVEATWRDGGGRDRVALALPLASSNTGAFSFFGGEDADLLVRVVDSRRQGGRPTIEAGSAAGVGFELRVLDTTSGVEWTHTNPRSQVAASRLIAEALEAGGGNRLDGDAAEAAGGCLGSATDLCFLGGRFRVTAKYTSGGRQDEAWATAGGGETGLFSASEGGDAEVVVRVVDGRAANGYVWLLYSALAASEVEIEIADLATGNSRRFVKAAGGPASEAVVEALSASATVVNVTLDAARAVTRAIGAAGGFLDATDGHGTRFHLVLPKDALISTLDVTLTPVATIAALPFAGGLAGAVYIQPEGFVLGESAQLTITPSPALAPAQQLTFAFRGLAGELSLSPPRLGQAPIVLPVHRLGGYGVAGGTAADLTAQLGRLPTSLDDRLQQQLAGAVLPVRRAGNPAAPPPASVLLLLQQDFIARIKPKLLDMKLGNLDRTYASVRNWRNSAKDTGQAPRLAVQLQEIKTAELAGAKKSYESAPTLPKAAPAPAVCQSPKAAGQMYRAYNLLKSHGAEWQVKKDALLRCARFELLFSTHLYSAPVPGIGLNFRDDVVVRVPLLLVNSGNFEGSERVWHDVVAGVAPVGCALAREGAPVEGSLTVRKVFVPEFYWHESLLGPFYLPPVVHYEFTGAPQVGWRLKCPERGIPGAPPIPAIDFPFATSWAGTYKVFHLAELVFPGGFFIMTLEAPPGGPSFGPVGIYAQKFYDREPLPFHSEDSGFLLQFKPK